MILLNDFVVQWREIRDDVLAAVERVGSGGWLILGEEVARFENELAAWWGLPHAVGCGNGLDAIEIALRALGLETGAKVLTTPLSSFATTLGIVRAGGAPVFVDVDERGLLDLELCDRELAADSSIRFMLPVHLYGQALDGGHLQHLEQRYGVVIVEDCAQAIGATSHGRCVGSVGDIACTSFYPTKNLGCMGDGGALLTKDAELATRARALRDYGRTDEYQHAHLGMNSRLDALQAAILRSAFLPRLARLNERRRITAERYMSAIRNPALRLPLPGAESDPVWHLFPVRVHADRESFREHLRSLGVQSGLHYPLLIPDQVALVHTRAETRGSLARARDFAAHELSLPIHPYLTDEMIDAVIVACNGWRV